MRAEWNRLVGRWRHAVVDTIIEGMDTPLSVPLPVDALSDVLGTAA